MNKSELVEIIQSKLGVDASKAAAERALSAVLAGLEEALVKGESVTLIGFGTFSVVERAERQGINPKSKEAITIPASKAVKFKAGAGLKSKI